MSLILFFFIYRGYDFLCQQLRIVLSNVDQWLRSQLRDMDIGEQIQWEEFNPCIQQKYKEAIANVMKLLYVAGEPGTVIKSK